MKAVMIVTVDGNTFDLKEPVERAKGLPFMLEAKDYNEPEVFTNCHEDEMLMFEYLEQSKAA